MPDPAIIAQIQRKQKARLSQKRGDVSEHLVHYRLSALGFLCIQKVHAGVLKIAGKFIHAKRVMGDFTAIEPESGRAVLVEVKYRETVLKFSDLREHQVRSLDNYAKAGAVALLAWATPSRVYLLRWPLNDFGPRCSLSQDLASALDVTCLKKVHL